MADNLNFRQFGSNETVQVAANELSAGLVSPAVTWF